VQGEVLPDAVGRPSLGSALLDDPGAKFSAENEQQVQKEKKRAKKKETQACGNRRPRAQEPDQTCFRQRSRLKRL